MPFARYLLCGLLSSTACIVSTHRAAAFELFGFKFFEVEERRGYRHRQSASLHGHARRSRRRSGTYRRAQQSFTACRRCRPPGFRIARPADEGARRPQESRRGTLREGPLRRRRAHPDRRQVDRHLAAGCRIRRGAGAGGHLGRPGQAVHAGRGPLEGRRGGPFASAVFTDPWRRRGVGQDAQGRGARSCGGSGKRAGRWRRLPAREIVADHDTGRLDVSISVAAGPVAGFGPTTVTGTEAMDPRLHRLYGGPEAWKNLLAQGYRRRARPAGQPWRVSTAWRSAEADALDASGHIPIDVTVSERKPRFYGVGATLSNTEGLGLEGYWGHRNLFGKAERLRIEGSIGRHFDSQRIRQAQLQCRHHVREAGRRRARVEVLHRPEDHLRTSRRLRPLLDGRQCRPRL